MLSRIIWGLILAGAVTAAAGWWFNWDWSRTFSFSNFNDTLTDWSQSLSEDDLKQFPKNVTGVIDGGTDVIKELFDEAVGNQKDAALQTFDSVKGTVVDSTKEELGDILKSIEGGLGLKTDGDVVKAADNNQTTLAWTVAAAAKVGEPVSFLLTSKSYKSFDYQIDWGDGGESAGALKAGEEKLVSHVWNKAGNYTVKFGQEEFLVRVIK